MPACLLAQADRLAASGNPPAPGPTTKNVAEGDGMAAIIALLRDRTGHDFAAYKLGTMQRRVERRMAMAPAGLQNLGEYLALLERDPAELTSLSQDLLINVTSFFRDPKVFETLEQDIIPGLIRAQKRGGSLRIWIAGCSTGEETYSIAMLCREQLVAAQTEIKLQIFASDIDAPAVAKARTGLYPKTIESEVSASRLARFFVQEDGGYRIAPELRAFVVFTVQDVLSDPPFSRLDLISCRNLLIYLLPHAQAQVLAVFHFALRDGGVLLLGSAETVGNLAGRFEPISKADKLYRRIGPSRPGEIAFLRPAQDSTLTQATAGFQAGLSRQSSYADLGRRLVLQHFAPAAVLVTHDLECLFSLGPTDRFLRVAPGYPSHDLLGMARPGLRTKLHDAIKRALAQNAPVTVDGGRIIQDGSSRCLHRQCPAGASCRRGPSADLLPGRGQHRRRRHHSPPWKARQMPPGSPRRGSPSWSMNWRGRGANCRVPSATWPPQRRTRRRSTKKPCRSTKNINPRTRSCSPPRRSCNR